MKKILLFFSLLPAVLGPFRPAAAEFQLTVETNWPALGEPIVDLCIPPTRSSALIAATRQNVFRFDESRTNWVSIYTPAAPATILGVDGYAKASSVLYVVHSSGVARTRDDGTSWSEAVPQDYEAAVDTFLRISVNPTNRREAVLAFRKGAWLTRDFGESYKRLSLPNDEPLLGITYAGSGVGTLVVLTERALHLTTSAGEHWVSVPHQPLKRGVLADSAKLPFVMVASEQGGLTIYDLTRPSFRAVHTLKNLACDKLATDSAGRGLLWAASGAELRLMGTMGERIEILAGHCFDGPVTVLQEHPRIADRVFCAISSQVLLLGVDVAAAAKALTNIWNPAVFVAGPLQQASADTPAGGNTQGDVHELLSQISATEPSLSTLLNAALQHARFSEKDINRWKKRAKVRNWLPEFRVGTGVREYPVDQSEIYSYVDRYGIPQRNDLRLSDDVEPLGFVAVTLVWDLSRLLYDPEEVDINQEKRYEMSQRNALVSQIGTLYYERLELLARARLRTDKMGAEERISTQLKIRQKTDLLNTLCGKPLLDYDPGEAK